MNVLVLGGTRFIGPHIVSELAVAGHHVTVFHRGKTPAALPEGVQEVLGDREQLAQHAAELRALQPDVVLDMIAFTEPSMQAVVDTFRGHAGRLVVISSCDVYRAYGVLIGKEEGYIQPMPLTEYSELRPELYPFRGAEPRAADDPRHFLDDYDKILVEQVAQSAPDLPAAVLRLPMVYGPHDGQMRTLPYVKRMLDERPAIVLSALDARRRFARGYVESVALACATVVQSDSAEGAYNVAEEPVLTEVEWVSAIAQAMGWNGALVLANEDALPEALRSGVSTEQDLAVSTQRIRSELGFSERIALGDAIARTVDWQRANIPAELDPALFNYAAEDEVIALRLHED
jgi:nucleoside-diphosphate-sugar epimerase